MDYLHDPGAASLDAAALGGVLESMGAISAKFAAARSAILARFDAGRGHDSDGYGSSKAWLAAKGRVTAREAGAQVRLMRQLGAHPVLAAALARDDISESWVGQLADWTKKLPEDWRHDRTEAQRGHDALQLACQLLVRARMIPGRAGADTRVEVIVALSQLREMPGGTAFEEAWLAAVAGQPGYLAGTDAQAAACDALIAPVVTGRPGLSIADQMIEVLLDFLEAAAGTGSAAGSGSVSGIDPAAARERSRALPPEAWQALRYAIAKLAVDLVSGPGPARLDPAARAAGGPVQRQVADPRHRPLRRHPVRHPPRGEAPRRRALRVARLPAPRVPLRCASPAPQERRRRDFLVELRHGVPVPPRRVHSPARLATGAPPRRHHRAWPPRPGHP